MNYYISTTIATRLAAATNRPDLADLTEISATRGTRQNSPRTPENMRKRMKIDEARAWSHSDLAGALWEHGIRASRAIAWANYQEFSQFPYLLFTPITCPSGVCGWAIKNHKFQTLRHTPEPANAGALRRIMSDAGFDPALPSQIKWVDRSKSPQELKKLAVSASLADLDPRAILHDLPKAEFETGGAITNALHEAGYDESGTVVINNVYGWNITVAQLASLLS